MSMPVKRIAVNCGGGFVPGLNAVITGAVLEQIGRTIAG